jgi:hypothetical protein
VPEQARQEVRARVDTVRQEAQALVSDVRSLPAGSDAAVTAAKDDLEAVAAQAQTQIDALWNAASAVSSAGTPEDTRAALPALRSAVLSAGTAVAQLGTELKTTIGSADPSVRDAFAQAPECQEVPGTATPSG